MSARSNARIALCAASLLAVLASAARASAYCRATTCDPNDPSQQCEVDRAGFLITGLPLFWKSSCVTVGVQKDGSLANDLSYAAVEEVVEQAFATWMNADCSNAGKPTIDVQLVGPISCGESEYNQKRGNANVVLFREGPWPYAGAPNAIALTTSRFDLDTGELWDADIELNSEMPLSVGDSASGDDLLSVLTHEAGHFLGLSHTRDDSATMQAVYTPSEDGLSFRTLAPDDVNGICSTYPPDRNPTSSNCEPRHGFSVDCGADQPPPDDGGCSVGPRVANSSDPFTLKSIGLLALLSALCLARRRNLSDLARARAGSSRTRALVEDASRKSLLRG